MTIVSSLEIYIPGAIYLIELGLIVLPIRKFTIIHERVEMNCSYLTLNPSVLINEN